jgi:hypothetical protein
VVFGIRTKQRLPAADAFVDPRRVGILILTREGWLGSLLARHIVLIRRELLLPSSLVLANFLIHGSSLPLFGFGLCGAPPGYQIQRSGLTIHGQTLAVPLWSDSNSKTAMPEKLEKSVTEKRVGRRAKIAKPVRVRPSEPRDDHFEDLPISVNASKSGIYFTSRLKSYYPGMRVFVTFPYSSPHDPMNCEYVAQVVRVEKLENGKTGVAVHLQMSMNYNAGGPTGLSTRS